MEFETDGQLHASDFQEGADHGYGPYTGENDIHLREADPTTPYPEGSGGGWWTALQFTCGTGGATARGRWRFLEPPSVAVRLSENASTDTAWWF